MQTVKGPGNAICGCVFLATAALFYLQSTHLEQGTLSQIGPGFFPSVLSVVLALLGICLLIVGVRMPGEKIKSFSAYGFAMVILAVIFFAAGVRPLGFLVVVPGSVLLSFLASRRFSWRAALPLTVTVSLFCWLVFIEGLGLPISLIGPWLGGH